MSRPVETDVIVVGGGVAGASTARLLAEAGLQVMVFDKATFPRDKPCGEGVMPTGVRLLSQMGILPRIPTGHSHPLKGVRFITRRGTAIQGEFPDVGDGFSQGMGIKRLVLDSQVLEHARAHPGVEVHEHEAVSAVDWQSSGFAEVTTRSGRYRARLVVGADGLRSRVRHSLGLEMPRGRRQRFGIRAHFALSDPMAMGDYVSVHLSERGECYTTPVSRTELEVALLVEKPFMRAFAGQLEEEFERYVRNVPGLHPLLEGAQRISPVLACGPFDVWARCRVADRAVLVGDAGGYLDPLTGEGISVALQSAVWAAEVIGDAFRHGDFSAARLMPYHIRLDQALRHYKFLTRALLLITRHDRLASLVARRLSCSPGLYSKLLAINCGVSTFWQLSPIDLYHLLFSRAAAAR